MVGTSSLVEDMRVKVNPGVKRIELSYFRQLKLFLKFNNVGILIV